MAPTTAVSWLGSYRYDPAEHLPETLPQVDFEMEITWRWFGRFTGVIVESEDGVPEPAQISGRLAGQRMRFTKMYRSFWIIDQSGEIIRVPHQRPLVLCYKGELTDSNIRIAGRWSSGSETRIMNGQQLYLPEMSGTWEARAK